MNLLKTKILLLVSILVIIFSGNVSAQLTNESSVPFSQKHFNEQMNRYFDKSKKQKKIAWILLGGGLVMSATSSALLGKNSGNSSGYDLLSSLGGTVTAASIPLFFVASKNKDKGQLVYFESKVAMASSDSLKKIYLKDAAKYFSAKAKVNTTTAVILTSIGGAFVVAGIAQAGSDNNSFLLSNELATVLLVAVGISFGVASIPFYTKGAYHKRTANAILRTERIPTPEFNAISSSSYSGRQIAFGLRIQL